MTQLNDICNFIIDCEHKTAPIQEQGYPSIRTPNIGNGYFILKDVNRVSEETYKEWTRRGEPQTGDLILAREAPVGNVAVVPKDAKFCLGQRTVLIRPNQSVIDPYYLCYLLLSPKIRSDLLAKSGGATVHHLNLKDIRALPIPVLPSLAGQRKLASIIQNYDDLIQTNQQRITLLEEAAQRLYDEWFVKLRFPNHEQVPVVDGVPEGWERTRLAKIAAINANTIKKDEFDSIRYVDISAVVERQIQSYLETDLSEAAGRAKRKVQHGDVIWSCVRPNRRQYALIWNPFENLIVSTGFCTLSADKVPFSYLYLLASHNDFSDYLENVATGSAYPAVTARNFEQYEVVKPSQRVLDVFDRVCLPLIEQAETLKIMNQKLMQARDELLPRLMSGRLDVSTLSAVGEE